MTESITAGEPPIPAVIELNDPNNYDVWALWVATDRKFLPSQLLNEPDALLSDVLTLDGVYERIKASYNGNKDD